jgi:D-beta-D-heptose 7-phosphate kinase/D-beta-D-heptose 1-phosphate adenosyltransferase
MTTDDIISRFSTVRVLVLGDIILDRYIWGNATRISQEAPVPVVRVSRRSAALGGAANVMRNLASLGVQASACGVIGDDAHGKVVRELCEVRNILTTGLCTSSRRQTTVKTRLIAERQQLVRIDDENDSAIAPADRETIIANIAAAVSAGEVDAIILEDYNKGVITQQLADAVMSIAESAGIPVALDPHPGSQLRVPYLAVMTPNRAEAYAMAGQPLPRQPGPPDEDPTLAEVASTLWERWQPRLLLITLGADGMVLAERDEPLIHVPTVAREVFDVSGAGDTVIATFVAALLTGASPHEATLLANRAGGLVVAHVGTVPVDLAELKT